MPHHGVKGQTNHASLHEGLGIRRVRSSAEQGDPAARAYIKLLDDAIARNDTAALQKMENALLVTSRDSFELIGQRETEELERLVRDRNVCAHPAFVAPDIVFQPTAELVRAHLGTAVDAVLRHGPTPGRKAIDRFVVDVKGNAWPEGLDGVSSYLRANYFDRGTSSLKRNLTVIILKGCHTPPDGDERLFRRMSRAAHAVNRVSPVVFAEGLDVVVRRHEQSHGFTDVQLLRLFGSLGDASEFWSALPVSSQARVIAALKGSPLEELVVAGVFSVRSGMRELDDVVGERLRAMSDDDFASAISIRPSTWLVDEAILRLRAAGGWRTAERRMRDLVLPLVGLLTLTQLRALHDVIHENGEVRMAGDVPPMMETILGSTSNIPGAIAEWSSLSEWLSTQGRDGQSDDYYAYPQLAERVRALS